MKWIFMLSGVMLLFAKITLASASASPEPVSDPWASFNSPDWPADWSSFQGALNLAFDKGYSQVKENRDWVIKALADSRAVSDKMAVLTSGFDSGASLSGILKTIYDKTEQLTSGFDSGASLSGLLKAIDDKTTQLTSGIPDADLSGFLSSLQGQIGDVNQATIAAQASVDAANAAAGVAQATANQANSAASTAQSAAETANQAANTAQSTANQANTAASAAQSTADAANTAAGTAQSTANSANGLATQNSGKLNSLLSGVSDIELAGALRRLLDNNTNSTFKLSEEHPVSIEHVQNIDILPNDALAVNGIVEPSREKIDWAGRDNKSVLIGYAGHTDTDMPDFVFDGSVGKPVTIKTTFNSNKKISKIRIRVPTYTIPFEHFRIYGVIEGQTPYLLAQQSFSGLSMTDREIILNPSRVGNGFRTYIIEVPELQSEPRIGMGGIQFFEG